MKKNPTCTKGFVAAVNEHTVKDNGIIKLLDLSMWWIASIDVDEIMMGSYVAQC